MGTTYHIELFKIQNWDSTSLVNRQTLLKTLPTYVYGNYSSASLPGLNSRMLLSRWSSKGVSFRACMIPAQPNIPLRKSGGICMRESSPRSIVTPSGVVYSPRAVSKHWYSVNIPNFCLDAAVKRKKIKGRKNSPSHHAGTSIANPFFLN